MYSISGLEDCVACDNSARGREDHNVQHRRRGDGEDGDATTDAFSDDWDVGELPSNSCDEPRGRFMACKTRSGNPSASRNFLDPSCMRDVKSSYSPITTNDSNCASSLLLLLQLMFCSMRSLALSIIAACRDFFGPFNQTRITAATCRTFILRQYDPIG